MRRPQVIAKSVLEEAREFFEERGSHGCEGTAMIIAGVDEPADRLVIPHQHAEPAPYCSVEVTREGKLELAAALGPRDRFVARIHSHPDEAFHSPVDDRNPVLTFEGALSIVVPFFGLGLRHGLNACAIFEFRKLTWVELTSGERERIVQSA